MKKLIEITKVLASLVLILGITAGVYVAADQHAQAANYPITGQNFYLAGAGVTSSQSTIPLTSFKTPAGTPITMTMIGAKGYGTLEPQSPAKTEIVTFTGVVQNANGTATLTGATRGLDFVYPYAASTTLRQAHSGGATFIISNTPNWYYDNFPIQGDDNVTVWPNASTSVATRGYVDYVAFNGASVINASTVAKGVVQIATGAQAAASTGAGSTGSLVVLPASLATSTYNSATAGNVIPVTDSSTKKIDNYFLATSTLNAYGPPVVHVYTSTTTPATWTKPTNVKYVTIEVQGGGGGSGNYSASNGGVPGAASGGAGGGYGKATILAASLSSTETVTVGRDGAIAGDGGDSSFGSHCTATGGKGSPTPGQDTGWASATTTPGTSSGCDVNITGSSGSGSLKTDTASTVGYSGRGGNSFMGVGGLSAIATANGNTGTGYGAGASGALLLSSNTTRSGAYGTQGIVIVTDYFM